MSTSGHWVCFDDLL